MRSCVLIVEDNPTNLKLAADVLEHSGFHVIRAVDAEQAQLELRRELPDLILMDIALPGMDGLALTRLLRADPAFGTIPIVALTAFAMKGDEQKALAAGCDGYITKPFQVRELARQVCSFLPERIEPREAP
jgi:CheY-like chemotaxis protein